MIAIFHILSIFAMVLCFSRETTANNPTHTRDMNQEAIAQIPIQNRLVNLFKKDEERFWSKVSKDGPQPDWSIPQYYGLDKCWNWIGCVRCAKSSRGQYGVFSILYDDVCSHRVSWILCGNSIPSGKIILHKCDNRRCVNPSHLSVGTPKENTQDMFLKGRQNPRSGEEHWAVSQPHLVARGSKSGPAKKTEEDILEIRRLFQLGVMQKELSKRFQLSAAGIHAIVHRKNWRHI